MYPWGPYSTSSAMPHWPGFYLCFFKVSCISLIRLHFMLWAKSKINNLFGIALCKHAVIGFLRLASHKSMIFLIFFSAAISLHGWEHMSNVKIRICSCSSVQAGGKVLLAHCSAHWEKALLNYLQSDAAGHVVIESDKPHIIWAHFFLFSVHCNACQYAIIQCSDVSLVLEMFEM